MTTVYPDGSVLPSGTPLHVWLLSDDGLADETRTAVDERAHDQTLWTALRRLVAAGLEDKILRELRRVLPDPLVDVLLGGVADYRSVREAARQSLAGTSAVSDVALADRTLHAQHRVNIQVDASIGHTTVPFVIVVDFHLVQALAHVEHGRIAALTLADPLVVGTVTAYGKDIADRTCYLRVGGRIPVDPPWRILSVEEDPAP
jgi:hypothetical protein